ncbi:MAG: ubiquitin [Oscillospiraceae bacterium]|nr:ubiquitin [Oscillospiraceae bacterium]
MGEFTQQQAETLSRRAGVTPEEARKALEHSQGDMLDAFLWLESQGKTSRADGGFYSTRAAKGTAASPMAIPFDQRQWRGGQRDWKRLLREIGKAALGILRHSTQNHLQIWRKGEMMSSVPVLFLILLFIIAYYVMIPAAILGLFLGCRYRFSGPDLEGEQINSVMEQMSDAVRHTVDQVKSEFEKNRDK